MWPPASDYIRAKATKKPREPQEPNQKNTRARDADGRFVGPRVNVDGVPRLPTFPARWAQLRSVLDATLQEGDVVLAHGESASAVLQFDGDAAGLGTAFFVVRVTDEVERDWTAKVPLAIPK